MSTESNAVTIQAELDAAFGAYVIADQSPGLTYGIVTAEGLTHTAGFGRANDLGTGSVRDHAADRGSLTEGDTCDEQK